MDPYDDQSREKENWANSLSNRLNGGDKNYNSFADSYNVRYLGSDTVCVFDNPVFVKDDNNMSRRLNSETMLVFDNNSVFANDNAAVMNAADKNAKPPPPPSGAAFSPFEGNFEPHDFGNTDDPTSFWGTVFHIVIISAGPAVLSIPSASMGVGYLTAFILTPMLVYLYAYNLHMVVWSEYEISKMNRVATFSYPEVVYHAFKIGPSAIRWFAPYGKVLSYVIFITIWFFGCSYNYIIICQNLQVICQNLLNVHIEIHLLVVVLVLPLLFLCWIRKLSYLVPFSVVGNIFNYITFILVLYYIVVDPSPWNTPPPFGSWSQIPYFVGTMMFTLNATGIMIPLKNDMKDRSKFDSQHGVLRISYVPVSALYAFLSLICNLKYGSNLKDSVIENLPKEALLAQAGILLSTITLIIQYPLIMYVPFDVIWNNILKEKRKVMRHQLYWEYALKSALVALSFLVSFAAPNVSLFLSLSGTVGTSVDSFILPAFMQTLVMWKICKNKATFSRILFKNALIVLLALIFVIAGCVDCIRQLAIAYSLK